MNIVPRLQIFIDEVGGKLYTTQAVSLVLQGIETMEWIAPKFEEVALNCEINSYACAAL
jgi:coenzyme PQQ precursor peptide PqqA